MKGILLVRNPNGTSHPEISVDAEKILTTKWGSEGWKKTSGWRSSKEQFGTLGMRIRGYLHGFGLHYRMMIEEFNTETGMVISHGYECFFCYLIRELRARDPNS